jgi:hypothetical protein
VWRDGDPVTFLSFGYNGTCAQWRGTFYRMPAAVDTSAQNNASIQKISLIGGEHKGTLPR